MIYAKVLRDRGPGSGGGQQTNEEVQHGNEGSSRLCKKLCPDTNPDITEVNRSQHKTCLLLKAFSQWPEFDTNHTPFIYSPEAVGDGQPQCKTIAYTPQAIEIFMFVCQEKEVIH